MMVFRAVPSQRFSIHDSRLSWIEIHLSPTLNTCTTSLTSDTTSARPNTMSDAIADPTDCFQLVFDKLGIISDELDRNDSKTVLLTTRELLELTLSLHKDAVKRLGSLQKDREIHEREKEADMRILQKKHDELDTLITAARHIKVNVS